MRACQQGDLVAMCDECDAVWTTSALVDEQFFHNNPICLVRIVRNHYCINLHTGLPLMKSPSKKMKAGSTCCWEKANRQVENSISQ